MLSSEDIATLNRGPESVAIHLGDVTRIFLQETGFNINSQHHQEVTRQCFDHVSNNFNNFSASLMSVPNFKNLLNEDLFIMPNGALTPYGKTVRTASNKYGVGIYMTLHKCGIVFNHDFVPYILEKMYNDICILTFSC